ncbi:hypothetical protein L3i23_29240 [Herbiconiux sp. L3-i23]|nr:hypothetical protein L3i23_29240 [Herbiconiux sp. L3-i23]
MLEPDGLGKSRVTLPSGPAVAVGENAATVYTTEAVPLTVVAVKV